MYGFLIKRETKVRSSGLKNVFTIKVEHVHRWNAELYGSRLYVAYLSWLVVFEFSQLTPTWTNNQIGIRLSQWSEGEQCLFRLISKIYSVSLEHLLDFSQRVSIWICNLNAYLDKVSCTSLWNAIGAVFPFQSIPVPMKLVLLRGYPYFWYTQKGAK